MTVYIYIYYIYIIYTRARAHTHTHTHTHISEGNVFTEGDSVACFNTMMVTVLIACLF